MGMKIKKKNYRLTSVPAAQPADGEKKTSRHTILAGVAILLITCTAYVPAFNAGYVWDDNILLYENPSILAPDGLYRIWCTKELHEYYPLTFTMLWLEWRIAGNNPHFYHAMNILLHALGAVLLWRVLRKLKVPGAYLAGLIFAVHPVAVASVAWIIERRNTLSMVLYLLSMLVWLKFEEGGRRRAYVGALILFVGAVLSKSSVVMLPVVLLLLAWWQRGRISRQDVQRVLPFFAASLACAAVTLWFHSRFTDTLMIPYSSRLAASGWIIWFYLYKVLLPVNLMMIYPKWQVDGGNLASYLPLVLVGAVMIALWYFRKGWGRGFLLAMAYFLVTLFPVLGFFKMGYSQHSLVSDHLQYVSMIGIIAFLAAGAAVVVKRLKIPFALSRSCAIALVFLLGTLTWSQCGTFKDMETLFASNIEKNDKAWAAFYNLGNALADRGQVDEAIVHYRKALEIKPDYADAHFNLGFALEGRGQVDEAIAHFQKALEINPENVKAHINLGIALTDRGQVDDSIAHFQKALEIKPDYAVAHFNLGVALAGRGQVDEAIIHFQKALEIKPDYAVAHYRLANILTDRGQVEEAIIHFQKALEIKPDYAVAHNNLGIALAGRGQVDEAIAHFQKALEIKPDFVDSRLNLEIIRSRR